MPKPTAEQLLKELVREIRNIRECETEMHQKPQTIRYLALFQYAKLAHERKDKIIGYMEEWVDGNEDSENELDR